MTETPPDNALTVWKPAEFAGADLLPVEYVSREVDTIGRDHVEAEDLILPTFKLLQGMSEEVMQQDDPEMRPGRLLHTGMREVFEGPVRTVLAAHTKSRALFPKSDNPRYRGIEQCLSRNAITGSKYGSCAACPHKEWGPNNEAPLCSESHNFTALTEFGPVIFRFARTSFKAARLFLTTWTMSSKPLWAHPVQISIKKDTKTVDGKPSTFFRLELKWLIRESVPPAAQAAVRKLHETITAAHEQGRFGADDDDKGSFDDESL